MHTPNLRKDRAAPHGSQTSADRPDAARPVSKIQRPVFGALIGAGAILTALVVVDGHRPANEARLLTKMAAQGDVGAELQLGLDYRDGSDGLGPDAEASVRWLTRAAKDGNAYAADALGVAYADGLGTTASTPAAEHWWLMAAQAGDGDAQMRLGQLLASESRTPEALPWLEKAAAQGMPEAQQTLDRLYRQHRGTADAPQEPGTLDVLAARLHSPTLGATSLVSHLLERTRTEQQSLDALRERAEQGDHLAQYQLGLHYLSGAWDIPRDLDKAATWLRRAAEGGNRLATQALARMDSAETPALEIGAEPIRTASLDTTKPVINH